MFLAKNEATNGTGAAVRCLEAANGTQRGMKDVMRRVRFATAALALIAAPAGAADIPRQGARLPYAAPAPAVTFTWTGPYLGVNLGHQWSSLSPLVGEPSGISGGIQGGYNWQFGQLVVGGEADIQASAAEDTFAAYKFSNPWFGTLRGRAGYAMNNILLYGTLGFAYGGIKGETTTGLSESKTHGGWAGGLGMEVGITPNWTARAEYIYMDLGDRTYAITGAANGLESNILRFGVNYRF